jgi:hypothetical protein
MNRKISLVVLVVAVTAATFLTLTLANRQPKTIFDAAFSIFGLSALDQCPGYRDQFEIFENNREQLPTVSESEQETLSSHWAQLVESERGAQPDSCEWSITAYPVGFIATGESAVIVINPSSVVIGATLPDDMTGDLVLDATRYSDTSSLGGFRGAATIPPRTIAVIALR